MELFALNPAQHRITERGFHEPGGSPTGSIALGRNRRFYSEDLGDSGEVRLPDEGLSKERSGIGAFKRVSPTTNPVHARSLLRAQTGALRLDALLLRQRRPMGYGFHLRRTHRKCRAWHLGAGASCLALPGVTRAIREFKNGGTPCT